MKFNYDNFKNILIFLIGIILLFILYKVFFTKSISNIVADDNNTYDLHVYPWGTQIMIKDLMTSSHTGDVINDKFVWERKPQKYSGFYQLDTGSHLLTDLLMMSRNDLKNNLDKHNIKYDDLHSSGYAYLQGGTPPINIHQDVRVDGKSHKMPVGLMALGEQKNMLREREIVNGVFGLAHIHDGHPLKNYAVTDVLFETAPKRSIMIDFKNERMIVGSPVPTDYTFKGKMDYGKGGMMRMDVWISDDKGEQNKLLVDAYQKQQGQAQLEEQNKKLKEQEKINKSKNITFFKTHNALCKINGNRFTNSENSLGAIYIIRDPRNIITSLAHHYQISKEDALDFMLDEKRGIVSKVDNRYIGFQPLFSWILNQKSWVENRNFPVLTIRYEDLQYDTFTTFKKVLDFINKLTNSKKLFDKEKAKESIKNCNFENLKKLEQEKGFAEAITKKGSNEKLIFFNLGKDNNYKELLNTNLINKMNDLFQSELVKYNYE